MADSIRKQMQEIALGIQDEVVTLPADLCEEALIETQFSLIAKPVNPRKQNLRAMLNALPRLWGVGEEVIGRILENRKIQFLFQSEESMASILRRGPWSFNDWMCVIQKWTALHTDDDLKHIPFWVQIRGIPLRFLTLRMVTYIGHQLGHFLETDFDGDGAVLVDNVRVKLLWNIDTPLRFQRLFQFGDEATVLKLRYEKLRNFCSACGMITHDAAECSIALPQNDGPPGDDDDDEGPDYPPEDQGGTNQSKPEKTEANETSQADKEEEMQSASKKRRTTSSSSPGSSNQVMCYEMRQAYATEDEQQCVATRKRKESEVLEVRNWFFLPQRSAASCSIGSARNNTSTQKPYREGTVGQKPPEKE